MVVPGLTGWTNPCAVDRQLAVSLPIALLDSRRASNLVRGLESPHVQAGHRAEEERRRVYYDSLKRSRREGFLRRLWRWIRSLFR
jgi:hypothetical protein